MGGLFISLPQSKRSLFDGFTWSCTCWIRFPPTRHVMLCFVSFTLNSPIILINISLGSKRLANLIAVRKAMSSKSIGMNSLLIVGNFFCFVDSIDFVDLLLVAFRTEITRALNTSVTERNGKKTYN